MFRLFLLTALLALWGCGVSTAELNDPDDIVLSSVEGELRANSDPDRVVVYSNNIENMIFDWKDLVHVMAEDELRPDVFLVQQMSGKASLDRLVGFMNNRLGVDYDGVLAQNHPEDERFGNEVRPPPKVTTGVIWRNRRFDLVSKGTWMPFGRGFAGQPQTCEERSRHSGYETLRVKLFDKVAKKHLVVVSLRHWTWEPCSTKNVREIVHGEESGANAHVGIGAGADLAIVAGDFNDRLFDSD